MLRFGIIGTNFISEWFIAAARRTNGRVVPAAVCSRDLARGQNFARRQGIDQAFDDLTAMAEVVDAVYVASPNAFHHEQALVAIEAGRHVLVEKTMATSAAQVREIFAAAQSRGVVAMEAMRNLHAPAHSMVRDLLPHLGVVRQARIEKLQYSSRYDRFRAGKYMNAFDPALGNSALADIGVYCLHPALDLFGMPKDTTGTSLLLDNGFEGAGSMTWGYDGLVVDLSWSKITRGVNPSVIYGEDAALTLDDVGETSVITLRPRGGEPEVLYDLPTAAPDNMHHELVDFADQVDAGATDPRWSQLSVWTRDLMDAHLARVFGGQS
ncbi:MAG: Gfo/Idh/MocA family oxidoreductase [Brooklawnia sp.]|nr:Gfo/Idh/MocA family oxidoreductase [Brooklawnia sp.]